MDNITAPSPRLLIATAFSPGSPGGSGAMLPQLIRCIPKENISWWSTSDAKGPTETSLVGAFQSAHLPPRLIPHFRFRNAKSFFLEKLWLPKAVRNLRQFIRIQKPDMLWILPHSWAIPVLRKVVPELGVPWHITVHDFLGKDSYHSLGAKRAAAFEKMTAWLYAHASSRDVISPVMSAEMERITGCKAEHIIRCGVEPDEMTYVRTKVMNKNLGIIRIGYAGTIIAEEAFKVFVEALKLARPHLPVPVEIHLFGIHSYRDRPWFDSTFIIEHGFLSEAELKIKYRECTWGLALMKLDQNDPRYNRFSFPCKFTMSLSAGLPIICLGHPESPLIQLAKDYELGLIFTKPDIPMIAETLQGELANYEIFDGYQAEILRCAGSEFNAEHNREILHSLFAATVYQKN